MCMTVFMKLVIERDGEGAVGRRAKEKGLKFKE